MDESEDVKCIYIVIKTCKFTLTLIVKTVTVELGQSKQNKIRNKTKTKKQTNKHKLLVVALILRV